MKFVWLSILTFAVLALITEVQMKTIEYCHATYNDDCANSKRKSKRCQMFITACCNNYMEQCWKKHKKSKSSDFLQLLFDDVTDLKCDRNKCMQVIKTRERDMEKQEKNVLPENLLNQQNLL
uniref:Uncharacterized protein n=1 Tax=Clytia hemisphaerica TaxID=252671 RepID=A0A7M5VFF8_9CNID